MDSLERNNTSKLEQNNCINTPTKEDLSPAIAHSLDTIASIIIERIIEDQKNGISHTSLKSNQ